MTAEIYRRNSVDVVVGGGLVRYGRVVDVADNGFFVDFLCPTGRRRFFHFDSSVFLSDRRHPLSKDIVPAVWAESQEPHPTVEVLMRESPSSPWTWFPAQMVIPPRSAAQQYRQFHAAVVRWGTDFVRFDIVPVKRIRLPIPSTRWTETRRPRSEIMPNRLYIGAERVGKWTFVKRSVEVPDELASIPIKEFRKLLRSECELNGRFITLVEVSNGSLYYLERGYGPPKEEEVYPDYPKPIRKLRHPLTEWFSRIIGLSKLPDQISETTDAFGPLPPELWLDVFPHLNTMMRTSLRAVCATWNRILDSPLLTTTIVITSFDSSDDPERRDYLLTAPIFKCLRSTTESLVVVDWWQRVGDEELFKMVNMIRHVAENNSDIRLKEVTLVGFRWLIPVNLVYALRAENDCGLHLNNDDDGSQSVPSSLNAGHIRDFLAIFRGFVCDSIRLIGGSADLFVNATPDRALRRLFVRIPAVRLMVDDGLEHAIWNVLEAGLPMISDAKRGTLSEFLAWVISEKDAASRVGLAWEKAVCKILCGAQSSDPRPQSHYPGKKWCVEGLQELQLDKLTRITLRFLILLANSIEEWNI